MKKLPIILSTLMLSGLAATAQQAAPAAASSNNAASLLTDPMNYLLVFVMVILLSTILVMAKTIKLLIRQIAGAPKTIEKPIPAVTAAVHKSTFWTRLNEKLNDAVPVEKEADVLLDHDYDGIKELDNNLPPWWKYGFYLTIIFAFLYIAHYHLAGSGNVQLDEYNEQLAEAAILKTERLKLTAGNVDETTVTTLLADADITSGQKVYAEKCLVCHGKDGEGLVGPNLTDDYWIHGGDIKDVFKIIKYGFPSKGMIAWQGQLTPVQIQQVASFIKSLKGTNPPNAKAPQGDIYQEAGSTPVVVPTDSVSVTAVKDSTTAAL